MEDWHSQGTKAEVLTIAKLATDNTKLLIATATGVRLTSSSKGMTGSAAHLSSTNRKRTNKTALVVNRPIMIGSDQLYAFVAVELILSEMAIRAAPTHPASRKHPRKSIRLKSCIAVCLTAAGLAVAAPELGRDGTSYRTLEWTR